MTEREMRLFTGLRHALRTLQSQVQKRALDAGHPVLGELEELLEQFNPDGQPTREPVADGTTVEAD